ncbi:MAG: phosphate-starvation-inducible PsiE family protein [Synechococcaceae cyanobacterium SM2_3_1]|nr:phosphate-starvation-inducible PsiE family protein [Synechococcaceae cyanobacterium SM2_3_1]
MKGLRKLIRLLTDSGSDPQFLRGLQWFESLVSKLLSLAMIVVTLAILTNLIVVLIRALWSRTGFLGDTLTEIFGGFLSVLIALELLENITAYLRKQSFQIELVIVTSLVAVARKIIILDLDKVSGLDLVGLALAILALSISYWIVRTTARTPEA